MVTYLNCVSPKSAETVVKECSQYGGPSNTVRVMSTGATNNGAKSTSVEIEFVDKRYPYDVADWANGNGHATDTDTAYVIAGL